MLGRTVLWVPCQDVSLTFAVGVLAVQDLLRFGNSSREYVLLHEKSSGED